MSSVSPSSSASQAKKVDGVEWLNLQSVVDAVSALKDLGVKMDSGVLLNRVLGSYNAYLRTCAVVGGGVVSPAASQVSSSASSSSSRSADSSRAMRGMFGAAAVAGRSGGVGSAPRVRPPVGQSPVQSGYCFRKLFKEGIVKLGPYPSFFDLMAQPAAALKSDEELRGLRVSRRGGVCHVGDVGDHDSLEVLQALARGSAMPYAGSDSVWAKMRQGVEHVDRDMMRAYPISSSVGAVGAGSTLPFALDLDVDAGGRALAKAVQLAVYDGRLRQVSGRRQNGGERVEVWFDSYEKAVLAYRLSHGALYDETRGVDIRLIDSAGQQVSSTLWKKCLGHVKV